MGDLMAVRMDLFEDIRFCPGDCLALNEPRDRRAVGVLVAVSDLCLILRAQNLLAVVFAPGPVEVSYTVYDLEPDQLVRGQEGTSPGQGPRHRLRRELRRQPGFVVVHGRSMAAPCLGRLPAGWAVRSRLAVSRICRRSCTGALRLTEPGGSVAQGAWAIWSYVRRPIVSRVGACRRASRARRAVGAPREAACHRGLPASQIA